MKYFDWNIEKNQRLKTERDVCFEDILLAIENDQILDVIEHKNQERYKGQKILVININNYVYLVPFTEDEEKIFLKTIIPSRKATKIYITNNQ